MKNQFFRFSMGWKLLFAVCALALNGCEDNTDDYEYNRPPDTSALSISPPSVTLDAGDTWIVFTAVGGTAPYHWSVRDASLGTLDDDGATTVVYNRVGTGEGVNIMHLRDANEWTTEAMITHTTNVAPTSVTAY